MLLLYVTLFLILEDDRNTRGSQIDQYYSCHYISCQTLQPNRKQILNFNKIFTQLTTNRNSIQEHLLVDYKAQVRGSWVRNDDTVLDQ